MNSTSSPSCMPFSRATANASGDTSVAHTSRSGRSSFNANATDPLPVPTSTTDAPDGSVSPISTSNSVSGRGISTRRSTDKRDPPEVLAPQDVGHGLACGASGEEGVETGEQAG